LEKPVDQRFCKSDSLPGMRGQMGVVISLAEAGERFPLTIKATQELRPKFIARCRGICLRRWRQSGESRGYHQSSTEHPNPLDK